MVDNPDWGRSVVYAAGTAVGVAQEAAAAKAAERAAWRARIVVDDAHFHVHGVTRAKPSQTDLQRTMLRDEPMKQSLKYNRQRTATASGIQFGHAPVPLASAPISIFTSEPFGGAARQTFSRTHDKTPAGLAQTLATADAYHAAINQ